MFLIEFQLKRVLMKELTRLKHLQIRNSFSEQELVRKSQAIEQNLFGVDKFSKSTAVLSYVNIGNEVKTEGIIKRLLEEGKTVCVPATSFKEKKIYISKIESIHDLEKKENGLIEPKVVNPIELDKIDAIIVPGIAFDLEGYRLGYGGGFYDRLARKAPRKTLLFGICFEENLEQRLPRQSHDAKMHAVVTDKRVVNFD